jgi:nicotinamidase-related amidase
MKRTITILTVFCLCFTVGWTQEKQMKTALLIIDVQNDYFKGGTMTLVGAEEASENIRQILQRCRATEIPVIHIRHIATSPNATFFLPNTNGAEIHQNVKPLASEKVIVKHYPNSFRETELLNYLKGKSITNLIVCGMMTHMCVDATVRAAKDFGFTIQLIEDACATRELEINGRKLNAEDVHNSFLAALNYAYATVMTAQHYLEKK